jgi:hypothetical protein
LIENRFTSSSSAVSSASSTKSLSPSNEHQIETPLKKMRRNNAVVAVAASVVIAVMIV